MSEKKKVQLIPFEEIFCMGKRIDVAHMEFIENRDQVIREKIKELDEKLEEISRRASN